MELGQARLQVTVDASGAQQGAQQAGAAFQSMQDKAAKSLEGIKSSVDGVKGSLDSLYEKAKTIAELIGAFELAKSFVEAGGAAESLTLRLSYLTGSLKSARDLLENLQQYTSKTAFGFNDVGESASRLTQLFKGNTEAVKSWIPLIGDLASATGQTIGDTTEEVIRLFSMGGNAAGAMRNGALAAMLDLQRGVQYSSADIRDKIINAWESADSKFRGAAEAMGKTWDGTVAQLKNSWSQFEEDVMVKGGVLDYLKAMVQVLTTDLKGAFEGPDNGARTFGTDAIAALGGVAKGVGAVIETLRFLGVIFEGIKTSFSGFSVMAARLAQNEADATASQLHAQVAMLQQVLQQQEQAGVSEQKLAQTRALLRQGLVAETAAWQAASSASKSYEKAADDNTKSTDDLFSAWDKFKGGVNIDKFLNDVNVQFKKNQVAADDTTKSHEKFLSNLRNFAPPVNDAAQQLQKLTMAQDQAAALQMKLNSMDAAALGTMNPITKAWADYAGQISQVFIIGQKWMELAQKFPQLGISEVQIRQQIKQVVEDEATARDNVISKIQKEADVIGKFEQQVLQDNALAGLSDRQKAIQEATNKVIDAFNNEDPALQKLHPLTQQAIEDFQKFVGAQYDQTKSINDAKQIIQDYAGAFKSGFDSMADDAGKFFTGQIKSWKDFGNSLISDVKAMIGQIVAQFFELSVINPFLQQLFGGILNLPTYGSAAGGMGALMGGNGGGGLLGMLFQSGGGLANMFGGGGAGGGTGFSLLSPSSWLSAGQNLWSGFSTGFSSLWNGGSAAGSSLLGSWSGTQSLAGASYVNMPGGGTMLVGGQSMPGVYTPSTFGSVAGIAGGLYAGYNEYQNAGGGFSGLVGGAAYGLGTLGAMGAVGGIMSGAGAAAGMAGAMGTVGLAAIPVVGWIALAAMGLNAITGGGLFGTSWKPTGSELNIDLSSAGDSVTAFLDESKKKALFGGTAHRKVATDVPQQTQDAIDQYFSQLNNSVQSAASALGVKAGDLISGSFNETFDKNGKVTSNVSTVLGKTYKETIDEFQKRMLGENLLALLPAAQNASAIADAWRSSADKLLDGAQMLVQAQEDINHGIGLEGNDSKLSDIAKVVQELSQSGETLSQTYSRLSVDVQSFNKLIDLLGATFNKSGNDLVKFAAGIETAAGGQQQMGSLYSSFYSNYFSPGELQIYQAQQDRKTAEQDVSKLGDAGQGLTFDNFRQKFEQVVNTLSPEDVVNWLQAGDALAALNKDMQQGALGAESFAQAVTTYSNVDKNYQASLAQANETYTQVLNENRTAILSAISAYDGSMSAQNNLLAMLQNRYNMELQYLTMIDAAAKGIKQTLGAAIESIETSQLDSEGKYNYYKKKADDLAKQLQTMTDPQEIAATVQEIQKDEQSAWSTLTPDQQKSMAKQFIDFLTGVQDEANTQLSQAKQNALSDNQTIADAVNAALTKVADTQQAAADTQTTAATTFNQAVNTFVSTPITVYIQPYSSEVGGYANK